MSQVSQPTPQHEQYRQTIRELSDRLVEAQRPIRILDAVKWDVGVQEQFFADKCRSMPKVDARFYEARPLPFDSRRLRDQFVELELDIKRQLGQFNPIGVIMRRMCREYETVIRMLEERGRPAFSHLSQQLYGGAHDAFHAGDPTLADLGDLLADSLANIDRGLQLQDEPRDLSSEEAVEILQKKLSAVFDDAERPVRVVLSDGIISDAAAGTDYLKIRGDARFSQRDLRLLEVHEGWVHLGTTLNGQMQPICTFLSKGPPSSTITQEGLAILTEMMSFNSSPARLRRLTNRIRAVALAQQGANFLEVFGFFRDEGFNEQESYAGAVRVFRGSTPTGGPFTKDLSYSKGFILVYNYIRLAVRRGLLDRIAMLFCGKTTLEDIRTLTLAVEEGIVIPPRYLPPPLADLHALSTWMCYSNFLGRLNLDRIEADYSNII